MRRNARWLLRLGSPRNIGEMKMNKKICRTFGFLVVLVSVPVLAMDCKVLLPEGAINYVGECSGGLANGNGRAYIPSRMDPSGYYEGAFHNGKLQGKAIYIFSRSSATSTEWYLDGKLVNKAEFDQNMTAANKSDWDSARTANTIVAYAQFIKNWQDTPQAQEAREAMWQLAYEPVKRTNTVEAYNQFIKDYPNSPHVQTAREAMWQLAYEPVKRTNTVEAYNQFIKNYPDSPKAQEVARHIQYDSRRVEAPKALRVLSKMGFCVLYGQALRQDDMDELFEFGDNKALLMMIKKESARRKIAIHEKPVKDGLIKLGMSQCDMYAAWGQPEEESSSVGKWGVHIQHIYGLRNYVYTENGQVTSWQN
jgi:hypothetical protein